MGPASIIGEKIVNAARGPPRTCRRRRFSKLNWYRIKQTLSELVRPRIDIIYDRRGYYPCLDMVATATRNGGVVA